MSRYYLLLAFDALLFGAIAMSLDLLIGYTGLVSFGHAAFYGLGAYATAIVMERGVQSVWVCLGVAILVVGLYALVVSYFATARRGIYFALLTLIFAEVVYTFFRYTQTFGGSDGIQGCPTPPCCPASSSTRPRASTISSSPTSWPPTRSAASSWRRISAACSWPSAKTRTARASSATTSSATRWAPA